MKNNNSFSAIQIVMGVFIIGVFTYVSVINILPNGSSNSYYADNSDKIDAKIVNINYINNKLVIDVSGNASNGCIKRTRSTPKENDLCWIYISNNSFSTSVYKNKKYYIWLMDDNGIISNTYEYSG